MLLGFDAPLHWVWCTYALANSHFGLNVGAHLAWFGVNPWFVCSPPPLLIQVLATPLLTGWLVAGLAGWLVGWLVGWVAQFFLS